MHPTDSTRRVAVSATIREFYAGDLLFQVILAELTLSAQELARRLSQHD
jgi:hypothetical protein